MPSDEATPGVQAGGFFLRGRVRVAPMSPQVRAAHG